MQPGSVAGADGSFFLHTGTPGTPRHSEIDTECIHAGRTLHTKVFRRPWCCGGALLPMGESARTSVHSY